MTEPLHDQQVWIGLAGVKANTGSRILEDADQAFVNVVGMAASKRLFRKLVQKALSENELELMRLEGAEPLSARLKSFSVHRNLLRLGKEVERRGGVAFDTFHAF